MLVYAPSPSGNERILSQIHSLLPPSSSLQAKSVIGICTHMRGAECTIHFRWLAVSRVAVALPVKEKKKRELVPDAHTHHTTRLSYRCLHQLLISSPSSSFRVWTSLITHYRTPDPSWIRYNGYYDQSGAKGKEKEHHSYPPSITCLSLSSSSSSSSLPVESHQHLCLSSVCLVFPDNTLRTETVQRLDARSTIRYFDTSKCNSLNLYEALEENKNAINVLHFAESCCFQRLSFAILSGGSFTPLLILNRCSLHESKRAKISPEGSLVAGTRKRKDSAKKRCQKAMTNCDEKSGLKDGKAGAKCIVL